MGEISLDDMVDNAASPPRPMSTIFYFRSKEVSDSYGNAPNNYSKSKKKPTNSKGRDKLSYGDYRFCRLELTADERDAARDWIAATKPPLELIGEWLALGYSVKFSISEDRRTCTCSVTCHDTESADGGLILSGKGGSAAAAWGAFCYKAMVLSEGQTWKQTEYERGGSYVDIG